MKLNYLIVMFVALATNAVMFAAHEARLSDVVDVAQNGSKSVGPLPAQKAIASHADQKAVVPAENENAELSLYTSKEGEKISINHKDVSEANPVLTGGISHLNIPLNLDPANFASAVSTWYAGIKSYGAHTLSFSELALVGKAIKKIQDDDSKGDSYVNSVPQVNNRKGYDYLNSALEKIAQNHGGVKMTMNDIDSCLGKAAATGANFNANLHVNIGHAINWLSGVRSSDKHSNSAVETTIDEHKKIVDDPKLGNVLPPAHINNISNAFNMRLNKLNEASIGLKNDELEPTVQIVVNHQNVSQANPVLTGRISNLNIDADLNPANFASAVSTWYAGKRNSLSFSELSLVAKAIKAIQGEDQKGYDYLNSALEKIAQNHGGVKMTMNDIASCLEKAHYKTIMPGVGFNASLDVNIGHAINWLSGVRSSDIHSNSAVETTIDEHKNIVDTLKPKEKEKAPSADTGFDNPSPLPKLLPQSIENLNNAYQMRLDEPAYYTYIENKETLEYTKARIRELEAEKEKTPSEIESLKRLNTKKLKLAPEVEMYETKHKDVLDYSQLQYKILNAFRITNFKPENYKAYQNWVDGSKNYPYIAKSLAQSMNRWELVKSQLKLDDALRATSEVPKKLLSEVRSDFKIFKTDKERQDAQDYLDQHSV